MNQSVFLAKNENNKINSFLLIRNTINQEITTESSAKNIERRLEAIIESIAGNHWWKDINGRYKGCNDAVAKLLGLNSAADIIGKTDYELPWAEQADELVKNDQDVMQRGIPERREEVVRAKDGKVLIFLVTKVPLRNEEGRVIGTIGSSVDITEQKSIERALIEAKETTEQANQAKTQFIANMSHDLRTPLQAILMMTEVLQKKLQASELQKPLNTIITAGKELMQLVEDVLSFSKLESRKQELHLEIFDLHQLIGDVTELMQHSANQKGLQLIINLSEDVPCHLISDATALRRILLNLLSNAIKFTEQGYVKLSVTVEKIESDSVRLKFAVEDTGIGIPQDKLESIFDRFSRVESVHKRYDGIGLGLAIVKQLVQSLGGEIQVSSELGRGSRFACLLSVNRG
jgi:two-component system aerobic respiration control sensor histidine kinase ArcB